MLGYINKKKKNKRFVLIVLKTASFQIYYYNNSGIFVKY